MQFTEPTYGVFFLIVFLAYWMGHTSRTWRGFVLLVSSYYFYSHPTPQFLPLIFFSSSLDYFIGLRMAGTETPWKRCSLLLCSICINMGLLAFFKYANFAGATWTDVLTWSGNAPATATHWDIAMVPGISFYTFQTMSYIISLYRKDIEPCNRYHEYLAYVSFFPHLVAGPIIRAKTFLPQILATPILTNEMGSKALWLIMCGLFKKMVIADYLGANLVDKVFAGPQFYSSFEVLMAIYGYAFQIYCDFSGYTDIAIGSALLLGLRIPENFDAPYKSLDIREFWRRWHISLSSWFRDYLYIPLGGNRHGVVRMYINMWIVMFLCGLWHGAEWRYIIWGVLHGTAMTLVSIYYSMSGREKTRSFIGSAFGMFLTFHFVCFAWIFFRAESMNMVWAIFEKLAELNFGTLMLSQAYVAILLLAALLHFAPKTSDSWFEEKFTSMPGYAQAACIVAVIGIIAATASAEAVPFVYYKF
ncbi:MAG TPA: MBOAT family protein [Candidatus Methylacidiphilales bacterium]|nr:MBOAT family protein [Candidatus Methylacidiphilales bacterium]